MAPERRAEAGEMFLVGRDIAHSLSPAMWNHLATVSGWKVSYGLRDVDEGGLDAVYREVIGGTVLAANVTMPHKAWAASRADVVTDDVSQTGAANFLQPRDDGLFADNTDVVGARGLFGRVEGSSETVVLGAGGTASALLLALAGRADRVTVVNRSPDRAAALADLHRHRFPALEVASWPDRQAVAAGADLIVNTVPIADTAPVAVDELSANLRLYDAIYRRSPTPLQREAMARGLLMCDGLTHLAAQAIAMLAHLGLDEADGRLLVEGLEGATGRAVTAWGAPLAAGRPGGGVGGTVWLIGMMGSGKTTVGRRLADALGIEFHDTDAAVEEAAGSSIPELWRRRGEEEFRRLEHEAVVRVAGRRAVVATGGGVVLRDENVAAMRRTGQVVWLDAPAEVLARRVGSGAGRPLLAGDDLPGRFADMLADRAERYRAAAHRVVDAGRSQSAVAEELEQWIGS